MIAQIGTLTETAVAGAAAGGNDFGGNGGNTIKGTSQNGGGGGNSHTLLQNTTIAFAHCCSGAPSCTAMPCVQGACLSSFSTACLSCTAFLHVCNHGTKRSMAHESWGCHAGGGGIPLLTSSTFLGGNRGQASYTAASAPGSDGGALIPRSLHVAGVLQKLSALLPVTQHRCYLGHGA